MKYQVLEVQTNLILLCVVFFMNRNDLSDGTFDIAGPSGPLKIRCINYLMFITEFFTITGKIFYKMSAGTEVHQVLSENNA